MTLIVNDNVTTKSVNSVIWNDENAVSVRLKYHNLKI